MRKSDLQRILNSQKTVFVCSVLVSIFALFLERLVGIGWDYHPDAVTYINEYEVQVSNIIDSPYLIFNNFQYVVVWLFEKLGISLIALNIVLYASTNVMITKIHFLYNSAEKSKAFLLLLLLANPYRLHLSSTILKDTAIIFLVIFMIQNRSLWYVYSICLMYRIASLVYLPLFFTPRFFLFLSALLLFIGSFFWANIYELVLAQNSAVMQFRDFDNVPNFATLGFFGVILRCILWPVLAITGCFFIASPSFQYLAVAFGSVCLVFYILLCVNLKSVRGKLMVTFLICAAFAVATTGFNSYIRYVYPILVALPLILKRDESLSYRRKDVANSA